MEMFDPENLGANLTEEKKERFDCALHSAITFLSRSDLTPNDNILRILSERITDLTDDESAQIAFGFMLGIFFVKIVDQHNCMECKNPHYKERLDN